MKGKYIFWVYAYFSVSRYIKEVKNHILRHNWIFGHTCCINDAHWQSSRNIKFLCKYYIVISDTLVGFLLDVLFLLLFVILSGLHEKPRRIKSVLQIKVHRRICVRDITFLTSRPALYVTCCCFLRLLPPSCQMTYLLNGPYKDT